jgi:hypothetical protein
LQPPAHFEQVEYYFSDENLPTDKFLLDKTGGKENKPYEIKKLCQFSKMRKYKPFRSVVESLKRSTTLEVIDNKYIKRRVPLAIDPAVSPEEIKAAMEEDEKRQGNRPPADQPWMTKGMVSCL